MATKTELPQPEAPLVLTADDAPLAPVSLILQTRYLDERGELRHVYNAASAFAFATAADRYAAVYQVADFTHRRRFELTGEHGIDLLLSAPIGIGTGLHVVTIAATATLTSSDVTGLVSRARKSEALVHELPGFVLFGLPETRVEDAAVFTIELSLVGRSVCIRKVGLTLAVEDARRVAARLALHKAQLNVPAGGQRVLQ